MLSSVVARAINHLLATDEQARAALVVHAGRTVSVSIFPFDLRLCVAPDGLVERVDGKFPPELQIRLTPASAARVLAGDVSAAEVASMDGDAAFAATIRMVAGRLRWDIEEALSHLVGDIAAHRLADIAGRADSWRQDAAGRLARGAAEYVTEEAQVLPPLSEVDAWCDDVDQLRDAVERLEKRIARLEPSGSA